MALATDLHACLLCQANGQAQGRHFMTVCFSCCSTTTSVAAAGRKSVSMARFIRSGGHFLKPEGALKRSDELLQVGQKNAALQTLHDVITSKRYRTWQKVCCL